jgi:hypothetical protein
MGGGGERRDAYRVLVGKLRKRYGVEDIYIWGRITLE